MSEIHGARIHINGIVQGVGFRPFVYGLAQRLNLAGWVRNTSAGVDIELDGNYKTIDSFMTALKDETPPLAKIDSLDLTPIQPQGFTTFEIVHSEAISGAFQPISPDVSLCQDCLDELFNPSDRRFRYPFINCTNCGPRFTIIKDIPYDRPKTTMAPFPMCSDCETEYQDPLDRRFHAQPVACPVCGPLIWFEGDGRGEDLLPDATANDFRYPISEPAIQAARLALIEGKIIAVKGLGGFHLACDATNPAAVAELRHRKLRVDKPFAVMMVDSETVGRHCLVNDHERTILESRQKPVVLLIRRSDSNIAATVAPGQDTLGVMLPYTPLHHLLLEPGPGFPDALVMTSGNLCEEPIASSNAEARTRLDVLADAFLLHNRDIHIRCDDSVLRVYFTDVKSQGTQVAERGIYPIRRSRGYAPFPVQLPWDSQPVLAVGGELKNTFCFTRENYAFLSHHIGDMENFETLKSFEDGISHFEGLFRLSPAAIAYDLHPNYMASRYALDRAEQEGIQSVGVQHHHAHIASCMAEHKLNGERPVIGIALDGTGYGDDDAIWGGEFLLADYRGYFRYAHLDYIPLPGGDLAVRQPWRLALAWLKKAGLGWQEQLPPVKYAHHLPNNSEEILSVLNGQISSGINSPLTSSMGRLFDAVSALVGVRFDVNYEAQAAIELEALVDPVESGVYNFDYIENNIEGPATLTIDPNPLLHAMIHDINAEITKSVIASKFHNGLAQLVMDICCRMKDDFDISEVVLSGGVWQNMTLLHSTIGLLQGAGFTTHIHRQVPANDGGLALGQAAIAIHHLFG